MNCSQHVGSQMIDMASQVFKQKLCTECIYEHDAKVRLTQPMNFPINQFFELMTKKLKGYNLHKMSFKQLLSQIEIKMKELWEDIFESIKQIQDQIEQEELLYHQLLETIGESSSFKNLEKLVQILDERYLEDWDTYKNAYLIQLKKVKTYFEEEIINLSKKVKEQIQVEISQIKPIENHQKNQGKELKVLNWDQKTGRYIQNIFQIAIKKSILYLKDGQLIRMDQLNDTFSQQDILNNLDQINYLNWSGNYGKNNQKDGKWIAKWNGQTLVNVGGDYRDDKKTGLWKEMIKNIWSEAQVFEVGEYVNNNRIGIWKIFYKEQEIGGGEYNLKSEKIGLWLEVNESFCDFNQVKFKGEYRSNQKIGRWDTFLHNQQIGGGSYFDDQQGVSFKSGDWIELSDKINKDYLITFHGNYKDGKKVGQWDLFIKGIWNQDFIKIGGGEYNYDFQNFSQGSFKIGKWCVLCDQTNYYSILLQNGQYQNGQKIGIWVQNWYNNNNEEIGGGQYNKEKIGKWIEPCDQFRWDQQIIQSGNYQNGKKFGRWNILQRLKSCDQFTSIGGGLYDQSTGFKIEKWVEFSDCFYYQGEYNFKGQKVGRWDMFEKSKVHFLLCGCIYYDSNGKVLYSYEKEPIIYFGNFKQGKKNGRWDIYEKSNNHIFLCGCINYNSNGNEIYRSEKESVIYLGDFEDGEKVGEWQILYRWKNQKEYQQIGGGSYRGQIKIGKWIELDERFNEDKQIIYNGEYNIQGLKVGRWNILNLKNEIQECGCINFDDYGFEVQRSENTPIIYVGSFKNGFKVGRWDIRYKGFDFKGNQQQEYKQIGGGTYSEKNQVKIGRWVELDERFYNNKLIIYNGEYNTKGIKVGRWDTCYGIFGNGEFKQIGGGSYDNRRAEIKVGRWIELDERFHLRKQVCYYGEYNMKGRKVGRWNISYDRFGNGLYKQIGGGSYYKGKGSIKIGRWVELDERFNWDKQITFSGEYNMKGKKIGKWNISHDRKGNGEYKQIGGGSYDKGGTQIKIGKWIELQDWFWNFQQVVHKGGYNTNGKKVGRWYILNLNFENPLCGCINFDDNGNEIYRSENKSIIQVGSFKNQMKVGRWDIFFKGYDSKGNQLKEYKQIGGGSYGEGEDQIKIGKWVEIDEGFTWLKQVTYNGEYNIQGIKVGRWDINYCKKNENEYKQIGGGLYGNEESQIKIGKWVELWENFENYAFILYNGEYNIKGMKVGRWDINHDKYLNGDYQKIGGGSYSEEDQIKIGNWVEIGNRWWITQTGEYDLKGMKIGKWVEIDIKQSKQLSENYYKY
ncbi:unnamed protein product [Paramecium sonneborni]|uniref:Uncharacterized protein n=1 Tax=Paramecium sonneborni TaxID=65129 RepID=A0A8S1LH78_9CILI|nr:unnamed protein product [Paramecium sonneborni]